MSPRAQPMTTMVFIIFLCRALTFNLVPLHNLSRLRFLSNITGASVLRIILCDGSQNGLLYNDRMF